jgi:DNA-binding NarL/FixJ family response regulator
MLHIEVRKILIVDDHQMMRTGLKASAEHASGLTLHWFEAGTLQDAINTYRRHEDIDLVLLDLNLPDSKGLQSLHAFRAEFPQAKLAIFSATEDEFVMRQAVSMGAVGIVPKSGPAAATMRLIEALLLTCGGTPQAAEAALSRAGNAPPGAPHVGKTDAALRIKASLNDTQMKVLELVLAGMNNQQIAAECGLALGTVKNTVSYLLLVFDVTSRAHLISVFR